MTAYGKLIDEREKSLERLATVVRDSNDAIILFDLNGVILQWNHGAEQMYGYSEKDALGINILNIVPENKRELDRGMMNRLRRGELVKSLETQRQTKDGRILEVWLTITVLYDDSGKSYAIATTERDITERNKLEKSLERLATVVRDSNDAIILFDLNGVILQWNHGAEQMYGYSEKDALGINILNIVPEDKREKDKEMMNSLRRGELVKSLETQRQTKDGRILEVWLTITVLYDESGKSYAIATTERDITERNKIEGELIQARESLERKVQERTKELEKANMGLKALAEERKRAEDESVKAKEQTQLYLDLMSHDINNLNQTAMGFLELALNTLESKKMIELDNKLLIEKPFKALTDSSALINNVRKLQRLMEEGVKTKPIDISEILKGLNVHSLYPEGRDITINIQPVPHYMVEANELLHDVFSNLITNAIKHSEEGKPVTIDVKVDPVKENGQLFYKCIVEDNGPGIPDEMKTKLFHRFQRGTTKTQGKGLGLYLVRTLVEGYHGKVWVEDRVPLDHTKGARFVVMLPAVAK